MWYYQIKEFAVRSKEKSNGTYDRSAGFGLPTWMFADREWGSMTCHEKLMHSFFLLTQEVISADVTHLAPFMRMVFSGRLSEGTLKNPPAGSIYLYIN